MLNIGQCRELIDANEEYTDEQIADIRARLYELGQFAFDCWLEEKQGKAKSKPTPDSTNS